LEYAMTEDNAVMIKYFQEIGGVTGVKVEFPLNYELPDWLAQGYLDHEHTHQMEKQFGGALWALDHSDNVMLPMYCTCKFPKVGLCAQININLKKEVEELSFTWFRGLISEIIEQGNNPPILIFTVRPVVDHGHIDLFSGEWEAKLEWHPFLQMNYVLTNFRKLTEEEINNSNKSFAVLCQNAKTLSNPALEDKDDEEEVCYVLAGDKHEECDHDHGDHGHSHGGHEECDHDHGDHGHSHGGHGHDHGHSHGGHEECDHDHDDHGHSHGGHGHDHGHSHGKVKVITSAKIFITSYGMPYEIEYTLENGDKEKITDPEKVMFSTMMIKQNVEIRENEGRDPFPVEILMNAEMEGHGHGLDECEGHDHGGHGHSHGGHGHSHGGHGHSHSHGGHEECDHDHDDHGHSHGGHGHKDHDDHDHGHDHGHSHGGHDHGHNH